MDPEIQAAFAEVLQRVKDIGTETAAISARSQWIAIAAMATSAVISLVVPFLIFLTQKRLEMHKANLQNAREKASRRRDGLISVYLQVDDLIQDLRASFLVLLDAHQDTFFEADEEGLGQLDMKKLKDRLFPATEFRFAKELANARLNVRLFAPEYSDQIDRIYEKRTEFARAMASGGQLLINSKDYREMVAKRSEIIDPPSVALTSFIAECSALRKHLEEKLKGEEAFPTKSPQA